LQGHLAHFRAAGGSREQARTHHFLQSQCRQSKRRCWDVWHKRVGGLVAECNHSKALTIRCYRMPTFLILKGSSVKETVRGANATALRTAVLSAAADAAKGSAKAGPGFSGKGQTLGSQPSDGSTGSAGRQVNVPAMPDVGALLSSPAAFAQGQGLPQTILRFLGLYFTTLFSLEPERAAQESPFAIRSQQGGARVGTVR
jgi:hypothetical protein